MVFSSEMRPTQSRYSAGTLSGSGRRQTPPRHRRGRRRAAPDRAIGETRGHRTCSCRSPASRVGGPDALEGEFVLLEEPAGPARGHAAAVGIVEADADGLEFQGVAAGGFGDRCDRARRAPWRALIEHAACGGRGRDPDGARSQILPSAMLLLHPVDVGIGLQQPVDQLEGVVDLVADRDSRRASRDR